MELPHELQDEGVDLEVGPRFEVLLADGAAAGAGAVPVGADAAHAEVVPTRRGDGLDQDVQADGTQELVPHKAAAAVGGHY